MLDGEHVCHSRRRCHVAIDYHGCWQRRLRHHGGGQRQKCGQRDQREFSLEPFHRRNLSFARRPQKVTVTVRAPLSLVSVAPITVAPAENAVTSPVDDTWATAGFDELHFATVVTSEVVPSGLVTIALSWLVCPTALSDETPVTLRTGSGCDGVTGARLIVKLATGIAIVAVTGTKPEATA